MPLLDAGGEFAGVVSSFTDTTTRHEQEAELRRTLAQLDEQYREAERARSETRAVLDATGEAIALVGGDRVFLSVNRRFCEFFDIAAEDVIGHRFEELVGSHIGLRVAEVRCPECDSAQVERQVSNSYAPLHRQMTPAQKRRQIARGSFSTGAPSRVGTPRSSRRTPWL